MYGIFHIGPVTSRGNNTTIRAIISTEGMLQGQYGKGHRLILFINQLYFQDIVRGHY